MDKLAKNAVSVEDLEDACLQCKSRREDENPALKSAIRKIGFLTAVCSVLCVLTISACGCSLYFYTRFQGFHQDLVALVRMEGEEADNLFDDHFTMEHNAMPMYGDPLDSDDDVESTNRLRLRRKKGKGNRKPKKCSKKKMRVCDCCRKKLIEYIDAKIESANKISTKQAAQALPPTASPSQKGETVKQEQQTYVSAAHYTTYVDETFITKQFGKLEHDIHNHPPQMHLDIPKWQGTLYRNRTFVTTAAPLTLRFFKEADWMENSTTVKIFDYDEATGKFTAKHTGLYHIYAHVLFYDVKTRMAIGLLHENKKGVPRDSKGKESIVFRCMESVDYVNPQLKIGQNAKFKSCSVNGVLFLNQGDTIEMQSLYKHTCLDLTYDATYFGAIYISTPTS